jgi:hypothetical protein
MLAPRAGIGANARSHFGVRLVADLLALGAGFGVPWLECRLDQGSTVNIG